MGFISLSIIFLSSELFVKPLLVSVWLSLLVFLVVVVCGVCGFLVVVIVGGRGFVGALRGLRCGRRRRLTGRSCLLRVLC